MAHGGIRYLENGEFRLVREAVQERNRLIENAPHLVKPLPTVIPIFKFWSGLLNAPLKFLNLLDRPSERGAFVIYFQDVGHSDQAGDGASPSRRLLTRVSVVFNVAQVENFTSADVQPARIEDAPDFENFLARNRGRDQRRWRPSLLQPDGELIRRVDGRRPRQFLSEEIFDKLGADFLIGLSADAVGRIAAPNLPVDAFQGEGMPSRLMNSVDMTTGMTWQRLSAELPSGNGFANGRSIALACCAVANGGLAGGARLLSPVTIALAGREHACGLDPYIGKIRLGLGFGLDSAEFHAPTPTSLHWGGYGGSWGFMDPASGISLGYAPNNWKTPETPHGQMALDARLERFILALAQISAESGQ